MTGRGGAPLQKTETHHASPSLALTLPHLASSICALLNSFPGLISSSGIPSVPGILCSPFGAKPLKAMLRRMSSTAEAERSLAIT